MKKIIFILLFLIVLSACKQIQYIPVESIKTEYKDRIQRNSVYLRDSIYMKVKNDTVLIEKYRYLYRDKIIRDSIYICDTIKVPYNVKGDTIVVEKKGIFWWVGLGAIVLLIAFLIYKLRRVLL